MYIYIYIYVCSITRAVIEILLFFLFFLFSRRFERERKRDIGKIGNPT